MDNTNFKELKAGDILQNGTYVIERTIGAGGFGITYKARHTRLNVVYAVKEFFINGYCVRNTNNKTVLLSGMDTVVYEKYRQKFVEEAQTLARLDHPNVVKVVDVFSENNTAYMVMPFVEGLTLQQTVMQHGSLGYERAVNYIAQLSEAVGYIHGKDILHRDIKPDNIIITPDNRAVLIDFGSAREFVHDKTQHHTSILTQGYAPLEQYTSNSRKGAYSDIYSLGAVFYFALTGQKPMDAATRTMETMPEPKTLVSSIPDVANRTILKAMQLKPEGRHQTVQEFMRYLLEVKPEKKLSKQILLKKKNNRKYLKIIIPVIMVVIIGIASFYFLTQLPGSVYLAAVQLNDKWGFIDKTGKEVIPLQYEHTLTCSYFFSEGLAAVQLNDKWGFIDKTGKEVIPCKYFWANDFSEGLAAVKLNDKWGFIDKTGKEVIPLQYEHTPTCSYFFSEGLAAVQLNDKWGFIDKTGKEVIPCKYFRAHNFSEGLAAVKLNDKWGFIDKTGKEVIPYKYFWAYKFSEGLAEVRLNGKYGFIDKTGKEIIPLKYDDVGIFSEGLAAVELNDKWGFIDKTGKEVIPCKYFWARNFSEGLAAVKLNDKWGFIDKTGKEVIPCIYFWARNFSEGLAAVKLNDKWGFIDKTGKEVIPCIYEDSEEFQKVE